MVVSQHAHRTKGPFPYHYGRTTRCLDYLDDFAFDTSNSGCSEGSTNRETQLAKGADRNDSNRAACRIFYVPTQRIYLEPCFAAGENPISVEVAFDPLDVERRVDRIDRFGLIERPQIKLKVDSILAAAGGAFDRSFRSDTVDHYVRPLYGKPNGGDRSRARID